MTPLRTRKTHEALQSARHNLDGCFLCDNPTIVEEHKYWYIVENDYPYDQICETHHMLVPKRHISSIKQLSIPETNEYNRIYTAINEQQKYDAVIVNFTHSQSHASHLHSHLVRYKRI